LNESTPGRIFISYRRPETAWPARQIYDVLVERFPAERVFKDIDSIEPGEDFIERITAARIPRSSAVAQRSLQLRAILID
jgi:hypothetical protein